MGTNTKSNVFAYANSLGIDNDYIGLAALRDNCPRGVAAIIEIIRRYADDTVRYCGNRPDVRGIFRGDDWFADDYWGDGDVSFNSEASHLKNVWGIVEIRDFVELDIEGITIKSVANDMDTTVTKVECLMQIIKEHSAQMEYRYINHPGQHEHVIHQWHSSRDTFIVVWPKYGPYQVNLELIHDNHPVVSAVFTTDMRDKDMADVRDLFEIMDECGRA